MPRLETEINQIYLTHPESKKTSLILYEEEISNSARVFILAELKDLQRKSEATDLKKITEIILSSFRQNKRLAAETLFESSLALINQSLADLAHDGRKSWVGKFSCLIAVKSGDNIFIANNGQTQAFLLRKSQLLEILSAEKRGTHPLKSFTNFTQGKLLNGDSLIIMTSNIFNYVSLELFENTLSNQALNIATEEISKILKDSMSLEQAFCAFLLHFQKEAVIEKEPEVPIYAPLPEEMEFDPKDNSTWQESLKEKIPKLKLPGFNFRFGLPKSLPKLPKLEFFQKLSLAGKFFFVSFSIFLILFLITLGVYGFRLHEKKAEAKITTLAQNLSNDMSAAQAALIYKNDSEALRILGQAITEYEELKKLDPVKAVEYEGDLESLKTQINKVSTVSNPNVILELKHHPIYMNRTSIGLLFANQDSNSLSLYTNTLSDYFLLNSLNVAITGITYFPPAGVTVAAADKIYHVDTTLKQLNEIVAIDGADFIQAKTFSGSMYTLNVSANQVVKVSNSKGKYVTTNTNAGSLTDVRDFAVDKEIYMLYPSKIVKITGGQLQAFAYPTLTDSISNASKIFVGTNIYILESNKKRVVILNKNGQLLNQIYFPSITSPLDLSVDEATRGLYILDDNKLYKITF